MGLRRLPPGGCLLVQFWCCQGADTQMLVPGLLPFHKCRVPYTFRLCCTDEHMLFHQTRVHCDRCTVVGLIAWTLESDELVFVMLCGSPRLRGVQRTALHAPGLLNLPKCRARACLTGLRRQSQSCTLCALASGRGSLYLPWCDRVLPSFSGSEHSSQTCHCRGAAHSPNQVFTRSTRNIAS